METPIDKWGMTSLWISRSDPAKRNLLLRSRLLSSLRSYLEEHGYVEVDTPILRRAEDSTDNPLFLTAGPGGWPRLHLRTCPEEYTRRAACALGKVFELGKSFRNECISHATGARFHLSEFTILEVHQLETGLDATLSLFEDMLRTITAKLCFEGVRYQGREIDFTVPFQRVKVLDALRASGNSTALGFAERHSSADPTFISGEDIKLRDLMDKYVRPGLTNPTFLTHFPRSADQISYIANGNEVERAELDCCGIEIGEAGVLEPDDAVLRKHIRAAIRDRYGEMAVEELIDDCYLKEIEAFNKESSVFGIGVERMLMIVCDVKDIREVAWYPIVTQLCER